MSDARLAGRVELLRSLAVLAEPPASTHGRLAGLLGIEGSVAPADYSDVFLFQLYPYASVHVGVEGMMGGDARERIAGFWRALGQVVPSEPDHLTALVGLYASLLDRERRLAGTEPAETLLLRESRVALMWEHLAPWVFAYLQRVTEMSPGFYAGWSSLLFETLRAEVAELDIGSARLGLPRHFEGAPALPDPREEGGEAFVSGLLAPVRVGMILTRADLAALARSLDLGLRAGERRYALLHLLGQDAVAVLSTLSALAGRRAEAHRARAAWLGSAASFLADRAERSGELLARLAAQGGQLDVEDAASAPAGSTGLPCAAGG